MIRKYNATDINQVLSIWLNASIKAHDFVAEEFWQSQCENMRNIYIPASETYVCEKDNAVIGFYSLYENHLAAIFVSPEHQGNGIGQQLMTHAKQQRNALSLSVYKQNEASYQFYLKQGFSVKSEQADEHTGCMAYSMTFDVK
ncbi:MULTISPECIES: N-acetyltransferase [Aliivibrio]|uniref:GNAT family N-acetyltransferase n=1 Tax=Aliivibrio logei 5S-186 TaxID=626086 RepID=A0ABX3AZN2_ALILO|nr:MULTISPECIES: N-acetyltransferase [Aliivibrio]MBB1315633.1 N-acetyltransferase [Aliivibrio sp. SR45-2]OEF19515.1 GNAT family N-acetyltransferase [Aliivibrio logei 5S-186]